MSEIVQWLIRSKRGEVEGPLTTVEVIRKIRSGFYSGEEYISQYPSGRWFPISYDENFFNVLLEALETELFEKPDQETGNKEEVTQRIEVLKKEFEEGKTQKNNVGQAVFEDLDAKTPIIIEMEKESPKVGRAVEDQKHKAKSTPPPRKTKRQKSPQRDRRTFFQVAVVSLVGIVLLVTWYHLQPEFESQNRIRLQRPNFKNSAKMSNVAVGSTLQRAVNAFRKDNLKNYLVAQDALIEIVEKSRNLDAYGYLCMTYRELWPFSRQDAGDHRTLQMVLRAVQKINPKSPSANICLVVSHWIKGDYDDALRIMDSQLAESPGLIFFNHMVGDIYAARRDYRSAAYYFSKVRELWRPPPVWSKSLLQEARMYRRRGVYGTAIKLYRQLLKQNPEHAVAQIEMGLIEFNPYQNVSKAKDFISSGISSGQYVPKDIESEAYVALAKISVLQGSNRQALKYSQKAFSIDSSNEEARQLTVSLGGIKALNSVSIDNVNMVFLGEQYMKMKNYTSAQAEFRAAYEANPKNGFAALRAGEALWQLGQSTEAISWVKRSIKADPNFIRSYLILADYQSERYDYINAIETLRGALRVNPRHHGIFRGFALIELRRRNYPSAVRLAKKALELYDTDIESLIILAKALNNQGNSEEAFQYLQRALELDGSNEEVHIVFSKILAALQGTDAGIDYLDSLITKYGKIIYMRAIGELLVREERYGEALQYYYNALEKNPKDKRVLMDLSEILKEQKRYDEARDLLLEAAATDPSDAEPLFMLGELYLNSGKNSLARDQFEKVIKVNPNYPLAHYYAGKAYLELKDYDQALIMAKQERLMNPEIPESYLLAAEIYYGKSQYVLCTQEYQDVLSKGLRTADIFIKLGRCNRMAGDFDSAQTMLTEAEKLESGNPNVYKELGALYHAKGQYVRAIESYQRYLQLNPQAKDRKVIEGLMKKAENHGGG